MKYYVNMSAADEAKLLDECKALDDAYSDAYAEDSMNPFYHLALAIWLAAQWELEACTWTIPREQWDTEPYRRDFVEDMAESYNPQRMGWVGKDGRP